MIEYFTPETIVLAHRGDSSAFPENTMPAFQSAVEKNVHLIETDVHLSADGEIVIWHDDTMERMSGDPREINKMTWNEIKEVDAGALFTDDNGKSYPFKGKNIRPVLLKELLSTYPEMRFNIDLKDDSMELVDKYSQLLNELQCSDRVITASFHSRMLRYFRKIMPEALTSCTSNEVLKLLILYRSGILSLPLPYKKRILQVPEYSGFVKVLSPGFIKYVHKRGFKVQVWTINDVQEMNRFLNMGVDGIFTDKPEHLLDLLRKRDN